MNNEEDEDEELKQDRSATPMGWRYGIGLAVLLGLSAWGLVYLISGILFWLGGILGSIAYGIDSVSGYVPVVVCIAAIAFVASKIGH